MRTLVVAAVDNKSKADYTLLVPGRILTDDVATLPFGRPLYRLAGYISRIFDRLFKPSAHDSEPLEESASEYPGYWSCCLRTNHWSSKTHI